MATVAMDETVHCMECCDQAQHDEQQTSTDNSDVMGDGRCRGLIAIKDIRVLLNLFASNLYMGISL